MLSVASAASDFLGAEQNADGSSPDGLFRSAIENKTLIAGPVPAAPDFICTHVIGAGTKTTASHSHKPQAAGANPPQRVLSLPPVNETANIVETKTKKKKKTDDIQQQQPSSAKTPKSFITYYQLTICNISASLSTSQPPPPLPL
jgi:hypothetical protein